MPLRVECPRCATPVARIDPLELLEPDDVNPSGAGWSCPEHGEVPPLRRPHESSYAGFVEHLGIAVDLPTLLPWPLGPGWQVTDFAVVGEPGRACGSMTCVSGTSALDGPVDVLVVTEEPGTGLGARLAGTGDPDPGVGGGEPPSVRVRVDHVTVPLWSVSTSAADSEWDRSVVAGEAHGRWLWLVLRPASAMLLLRDDWILRDVSGLGPPLVELAFGGPPPRW